jgi:hypothetical protein
MIVIPKRKYVLNLRKGGLQEIVFKASPRPVSRAKASSSKALRAGVLTRLAHRIINKKNTPK